MSLEISLEMSLGQIQTPPFEPLFSIIYIVAFYGPKNTAGRRNGVRRKEMNEQQKRTNVMSTLQPQFPKLSSFPSCARRCT